MIRPQRNVKFLPQTEKWFVGDDACIVPNDGLYRIYYHIIPRMTVGAQCVPLRIESRHITKNVAIILF